MLGEGAARNVNRVTMTESPRSPPLSAAFDGESLSPPSARLLSDLLSQRLLLSIRELLSKRSQKFQIVLVSGLCLYVFIFPFYFFLTQLPDSAPLLPTSRYLITNWGLYCTHHLSCTCSAISGFHLLDLHVILVQALNY